jgi:hypothetical protein
MAPDNKRQFLRACPNCSEGTGLPVRITDYTKKLVGVWLRCEICSSEWVLTGDAAAARLKGAADPQQRRPA